MEPGPDSATPDFVDRALRLAGAHPQSTFLLEAITFAVSFGLTILEATTPCGESGAICAVSRFVGPALLILSLAALIVTQNDKIGRSLLFNVTGVNEQTRDRTEQLATMLAHEQVHTFIMPSGFSTPYARTVIDEMCLPVAWKAVRAAGRPVARYVTLEIELGKISARNGMTTVVTKGVEKSHLLVPWENASRGSLFAPIFVCTTGALASEAIMDARFENQLDLRYPLPHDWFTGDPPRSTDWLKMTSLVTSALEEPTGFDWSRVTPQSASDLAKILEDYNGALKGKGLDTLASALFEHCLCALHPVAPTDEFHARRVGDAYELILRNSWTYEVCIGHDGKQRLRYEVMFNKPTLVEEIKITLKDDAEKEWILEPPVVSVPQLVDGACLPWGDSSQSIRFRASTLGAPFLAGHGVTFLWRKPV